MSTNLIDNGTVTYIIAITNDKTGNNDAPSHVYENFIGKSL